MASLDCLGNLWIELVGVLFLIGKSKGTMADYSLLLQHLNQTGFGEIASHDRPFEVIEGIE